ncbi:Zn-ribbon domain-containing OB-fold protein [Pikeienuella piscinae]|uniref:Zn-ribbon domain-containing OB-fold protein n=1 Tax=Pikeienuella piscinae TaxID=2748098 RepID=A0A7L5BY90_9RHOB|nr:Zn-ribbon domain-containing OB-fold protein [Pikeienuella piscinae]QIE56712.1 Zn-ribbon domain-containing OB-fold protein [Pikeienuella piscinae]
MNEFSKPIPVADADSATYWEGCREGRLLIQRCSECETLRFPPNRICAACHSDKVKWVEASGKGRVYSWIVVNHPVPREVYGDDVPYAVALIELEEGVRMVSNVIGCDPHAIAADMSVEVVFESGGEGVVLPKFQPMAG